MSAVEWGEEMGLQDFLDAARREAQRDDFGDESFIEPLRKLLDCAKAEVDFHAAGLAAFRHNLHRCLVNRLRMQADLLAHPEILDEDVSDPIVIIGLGRSGTTKLQKMLSAPDNVQKTTFWRLWNPARFPDTVPGREDPRIAAANFSALMTDDKPELAAAHHMAHTEVEEDWLLYTYSFEDWIWSVLVPSFSWFDWVMQRPALPRYQYVKTILQYLQWQDGGKRGRPWVLKSVGHLAHLDALMRCYPNATLVHAHRDPLQTIPSWAAFQREGWAIHANRIALERAGPECLRQYRYAMDRYLELRRQLNLDARIVDVRYDDIRSRPMDVMQQIYRASGLRESAEAIAAMRAWDRANEQGKHGVHHYSLEACGLTRNSVQESFALYVQRFFPQ